MRRLAPALLLSVGLAFGAGCSGDDPQSEVASLGDSPASASPTEGTTGSGESGTSESEIPVGVQLTRCLRKEGVDVADPEGGELTLGTFRDLRLSDPKTFTAMQTCRQKLITDGALDPDAYEIDRDQVLKLAECAREQGIDIDDPTFAADGSIIPPKNLADLDFGSPEFQRVLSNCRQFLPMPGGSN